MATLPMISPVTIRLDKSNYHFWKSQVTAIACAHGYDGFLDGLSIAPPQFLENPAADDAKDSRQINPEYLPWLRKDRLLFGWLLSSISESMLGHISRCKTSAEIWSTMETLFLSQSRARSINLRVQLTTTKKGDLSVDEYVLKMKMIADTLQAAGIEISDDELIAYILQGCGPSFEPIVLNLSTRMEKLSLLDVQSALQTFEIRLQQASQAYSVHTDFHPSANLVSGSQPGFTYGNRGTYNSRGRGRGRGRSGRGSVTCQICGKNNHIASKCFKRFDQTFTGINLNSAQAHMTTTTSNDSFSSVPTVLFAGQDNSSCLGQHWYMDSGATAHVTPSLGKVDTQTAYKGQEKLAVGAGESHLSSGTKMWKFLSYNIWFREDLEMHNRMKALGNLIQLHSPDVICLQEVTPSFYEIFQKASWWKGYSCSIPDPMAIPGGYFCMQLSKLPVKSYNCIPFHNSIMGRELCIAEVEVQPNTTIVVATSHLESPCPSPPTWDQMFSKERVQQAKEAVKLLEKNQNVMFCGDMNWDDKRDGSFPFLDGWTDAWTELRPGEVGWTYDTKSNKMLSGNRTLQKRLDRFICKLKDFKTSSIEMIGTDAIPGLSYVKEQKVKGQVKELELPVLPSDHYGLLLTICPSD